MLKNLTTYYKDIIKSIDKTTKILEMITTLSK